MDVKEYLKKVRELDNAIQFKDAQREEIINEMAAVRAVSYDKDRVQSSPSGDQMVNLMIRLEELAGDINKMRTEYFTQKNDIINQIILLHDPRYADLLYKHYVEYKSLEKIAADMNYSYDHIRRLHRAAKKSFAETYPDFVDMPHNAT